MNWKLIPGIACILSFLFPVAVILYNRFFHHRSLIALMIYCILTAFYNMMSLGLIPSSPAFRTQFSVMDNYLDVPLMLTTLLFFCPNKQKQSMVLGLIVFFICYEMVVTLLYGFTPEALVYILGPGLTLVLIYTSFLFARQVKFTIVHGKNTGRTIMLASILFLYACYSFIYYVYFVAKTPFKDDAVLIYHISSFIATSSMGIGLHLMRKRMKELKMLKVTRKELALFFGH